MKSGGNEMALIDLEDKIVEIVNREDRLITAKGFYHPRHLFYHCLPRNLPDYANIFTNIYKSPTD